MSLDGDVLTQLSNELDALLVGFTDSLGDIANRKNESEPFDAKGNVSYLIMHAKRVCE